MLANQVDKKSYFIVFLLLLCTISGKSQIIYDIDFSSDSVAYALEEKANKSTTIPIDFVISWQQLNLHSQQQVKNHLKEISDKGLSFSPVASNYLQMINLALTKEGLDQQKFDELINVTGKVIKDNRGDKINEYFKTLITFFNVRGFHYERAHKWLVSNDRYTFVYKEDFVAEVTPEENYDSWEEEEAEEVNWDEEEQDPWAEEEIWEEEEETWEDWDTGWEEESEESTISEDDQMLLDLKSTQAIPFITGAAIEFETLDLNLVTPYDSIFIKNTAGTFDLINNIFVGKDGSFDWASAGLENVNVDLPEYLITPKKNSFRVEGAVLSYPDKLEEEVTGVLEFKSVKRDTIIKNPYPRFMSNFNNVKLKGYGNNLIYTGGFTLKGQRISSASVMGGLSKIVVKNEGQTKAKSFSELYVLEDSSVYSEMAAVTLWHGKDSITHPAIRIRFNTNDNSLLIQKADNNFRNTPFTSSYFKLSFQADILKWDITKDSLDISILQGRKIVPAKFESTNHYNEADYRQLGDPLYNFHPLGIIINYARKNQTDEFYTADLATHFKLDENIVHGAMVNLMQKGLISYNKEYRLIKVTNKAKHMFDSRFKLADYDNIIIESVSEGMPNATMNFRDGYIKIRGVEEFLISDSLYVKIEPDSAELVMYENRDFSFNGKVTAGNFEYIGHDFTFNYDSFLIKLRTIDSVRFFIQEENTKGQNSRHKVNNALVGLDSTTATSAGLVGFANRTSGTLYINTPGNKSNRNNVPNYPKFAAGEGAVVYFDRNNVLNGVYKKDIYFVIPPFDIDSLNDSDPTSIGFDGIFISKGMLPNIEERLHYVGNNAMGFEHSIANEGYNLYNGQGKIFGEMNLNSTGLRVDGAVAFLSTKFESHDILLHPDSLVATGTNATISEEAFDDVMFPQARLDSFKVKWLPDKDQMMFQNKGQPFTFYNGIASFEGEVMVRTDGVFGNGKVAMKGSRATSKQMKFESDRFLARHADFEVETNNPDKPALSGNDVRVHFNLEDNYAEISPEVEGQAAIEFPYAQFKTSITNARWNLRDGTISMAKPDDVPLSSSYFYTTREDLDSLAFNATKAVYNIHTQEMTVSGIPFIKVADAMITPENNEVLILENSRIGQLTNTTIILDTLYQYHRLTNGVIDIISRNEFSGYATYQFINASKDTFSIKMENFRLESIIDENNRGKSEGSLHTVANGSVVAEDKIIISPGMFYKGDMTLYAHQPAMELNGYVKLNFTTIPGYDTWIKYSSSAEQQEVKINYDEAITEGGKKLDAGLLFNMYDRSLYGIFVNEKMGLDDEYFFKPSGILHYDPAKTTFIIEDTAKASGAVYKGKHFSYQEYNGDVKFEGPVTFMKNTKDVEVKASVLGQGNLKEEQFELNSFLTFNFNIPSSAYEIMAADIIDVVTNLGAPEGRGDQTELLYKLSNIMGERATREFETASLQEYIPLGSFASDVSKPIVFSDVDLKWSPKYKAFYSGEMLGLSNIDKNEVNASFEGFMELKKNESGGPVINIFIKASAASWYYFGLEENRLLIHSSNEDFNQYITRKSNATKAKIDELVFLPGTDAEVLDFINRYRFEYYGLNLPYDLNSTSDVVEEKETPTDEVKDDGFDDDGF